MPWWRWTKHLAAAIQLDRWERGEINYGPEWDIVFRLGQRNAGRSDGLPQRLARE